MLHTISWSCNTLMSIPYSYRYDGRHVFMVTAYWLTENGIQTICLGLHVHFFSADKPKWRERVSLHVRPLKIHWNEMWMWAFVEKYFRIPESGKKVWIQHRICHCIYKDTRTYFLAHSAFRILSNVACDNIGVSYSKSVYLRRSGINYVIVSTVTDTCVCKVIPPFRINMSPGFWCCLTCSIFRYGLRKW